MLVLTRKAGECVDIGADIKICVLGVTEHGVVRIGITAPKEVVVMRDNARQRKPRES